MIYVSKLQEETLSLVDKLINENKTFDEIVDVLYENDLHLGVDIINGYASKKHYKIYKNNGVKNEYSFVDLIRRKNGLAYWETYRLS